MWVLRKVLTPLSPVEAMELLLSAMLQEDEVQRRLPGVDVERRHAGLIRFWARGPRFRRVIMEFCGKTQGVRCERGDSPQHHQSALRCACGATWKTRSTKNELYLEICSNCQFTLHRPSEPGSTRGKGRVERFTKKFGAQDVREPQEGGRAKAKKDAI